MNLKQKIWDFFKQKEDIVDHELNRKIGVSITELNRRVHNLEMAMSDLEKRETETSSDLKSLKDGFNDMKLNIRDMSKIYNYKINQLTSAINDKK